MHLSEIVAAQDSRFFLQRIGALGSFPGLILIMASAKQSCPGASWERGGPGRRWECLVLGMPFGHFLPEPCLPRLPPPSTRPWQSRLPYNAIVHQCFLVTTPLLFPEPSLPSLLLQSAFVHSTSYSISVACPLLIAVPSILVFPIRHDRYYFLQDCL